MTIDTLAGYLRRPETGGGSVRHSHGPWRLGKDGQSIVCDPPKDLGVQGKMDIDYYGGWVVCETVAPCSVALIIAAPDLLEALDALLIELDSTIIEWDADTQTSIKAGRAAIAKATGEQP